MSSSHPRTLDPKLDVVFKLLFADQRNRPLLISLLSAVLQPKQPIREAEVLNPKIERETLAEKGAVLDIRVQLQDGRQVDVEMQVAPHPGLRERVLYYWARLYVAQLHPGDLHTQLQPVVGVFIANFRELPDERFHSTFRLLEVHSQRSFSEALQLHFLELPKLPSPSDVESPDPSEAAVLKWGRFLAAQSDQELTRLAMTDSDLRAAKAALDRLSADPEAQRLAEERRLAVWNHERTIHLSRAEGHAEGRIEGRAEGRIEGRVEGRAEGESALRQAVRALCEVLEIPLTPDREQALVAELRTQRAWPD